MRQTVTFFACMVFMALMVQNVFALTGYKGTLADGIGLLFIYDDSLDGSSKELMNLDATQLVDTVNKLLTEGPSAYGWNYVFAPFVSKDSSGNTIITVFTVDSNRQIGQEPSIVISPATSSTPDYPIPQCVSNGTLNGKEICKISGEITSNTRLSSDKLWELSGKVSVKQGAEIAIEPGTTVFGSKYDSTPRDYLVIEKGAKIYAVGTKDAPIVFTGRQALEGTDTESAGQWGGVIIAGNAPVNVGSDATFEADPDVHYGGDDINDSSGVMKYVIIRNGGAEIAPDEEINGLTLCGVGSGTQFDYIEVYRNLDDGIECFGGQPQLKHIVLIGNEDDNLDTDQGTQAKFQYVYVKQTIVSSKDPRGIEADNLHADNDALPRSNVKVANLTIEANVPASASIQPHEAIMLRRGTDYHIFNARVIGQRPDNCLEIRNDSTWTALSDIQDTVPTFVAVSLEGMCDKDGDGNPDYFGIKDNTIYTQDDIDALFSSQGQYSAISFNNAKGGRSVTPVDPSMYDPFFDKATFLGAYDSSSDWRQGWAIGLND